MGLDILLENGRIIDGTGAPQFDGAVGIEDGQIRRLFREARPDSAAADEVNLDGLAIAPGFIDTHSHSDLHLFEDPTLAPKLSQGITTEILGHDGFSMAPIPDDGIDDWQAKVRGLAGSVGVEWTWNSLGEYLDAVAANGVAPNVASLVGHGAVRFSVLGMADREPTAAEQAEMEDLVVQSLAEGAAGLSAGLIYPPSGYADTTELLALAERAAAEGRPFSPHLRSEGRWIWDAIDELVDIGAETGVTCHLTHFKMAGTKQHGRAERGIHRLEAAQERGIDIVAEQYPYTAASTKLSTVLPPWVHAKERDELFDALRDEDARTRMKRDIREWRIEEWENFGALAGWESIDITNVPSEANTHVEGMTVAELAQTWDQDPVDAVCELLLEEEMGVSMVLRLMTESDVEEILAYEDVNIATDGLFGGTPHPRVYGSFPRVLGRYVREKNVISLEEAVRKMTSLPARTYGFNAKGVIRPDMDADLVVFDPDLVESPATFKDPKRRPRGVAHVLVNGEFAVRDGDVTGLTPGEVLRK